MLDDRIVFLGSYDDKPYAPYLKSCVGGYSVQSTFATIKNKTEVIMFCQKHRYKQILSTSVPLLEKLLDWDQRKKPSLSNYAGSHFWLDEEIEIIFIPPLRQIMSVPYGKFLTTRLVEKFTKRGKWWKPTPFSWTQLQPDEVFATESKFRTADYICVDIETVRPNTAITYVSYTAFWVNSFGVVSDTVVIPIKAMWQVDAMRRFNALPADKILQNGKYDISYFARFSAPLTNYRWDTAALFHAWLSELPKDLGFLNSFLIREAMYWKDLAHTQDEQQYMRYNALDTWGTGNAFFAMMTEYPAYALTNYALEFPNQFPCHLAEMIGIARDTDRFDIARAEQDAKVAANTASLNKILQLDNFNTNSPIQVKQLLHVLGCKDLKSADEKNLEKARFRHPLNARILQHVIDNRKARKLVSTYLIKGEKAKEYKGRVLFALNPHGTDTSRLASAEHHFWCGFNIQNQPRGPEIKQTYIADPGYYFAECDLSQAETWDTAYISGDAALIAAVNSEDDFHSGNASRFFGIAYELIFDNATRKKLNVALRDLAKRVNHGTNYNMGPHVLIDTMGMKKIVEAKALLKLPRFYTMHQVAEHLLEGFHIAYPGIRKTYYAGMVEEVELTGFLRSKAVHHDHLARAYVIANELDFERDFDKVWRHTGAWTRRTFGKPKKSKPQLNSLIAHCPQSLNAQTLNKAWLSVFKRVALHPEHGPNIKLCAQVHDSILFQYRKGQHYICEEVRKRMEIPVTLKGYDDKVRTFTVPADIKAGIGGNPARYWSETE